MEDIDLTRVLPDGVSMMLSAGGILVLSVLIVMIIVIIKRWQARPMPFILGTLAYIIFVFVFTNLVMSALAMVPNIDMSFTYNPQNYTIIYYLVASVAFLAARVLIAKMLLGRYERKGDVYLAGIGLGVGDCVLYGMTAISYYVWCIAINGEGLQTALEAMAVDEIASTYESISVLFDAPVILWLLLGINAVFDMLVCMALTNVTFGAAKEELPKYWYGITTGLYFANALSFQLYDTNSITSIAVWFAVKMVIFAATMYYTFRVAGREIKYSDD